MMIRGRPVFHRWDGVALAVLTAFWAVRFAGVIANLGSDSYLIRGDHDDALEQAWMSWWAGKALLSSEYDLLSCPLLNHPYGSNAMSVSVAYVHVSISGLLRPLLGPIAAINAVFVGVNLFVLVALYALLRGVGGTRPFACGGAILFLLYAVQANGEYPDLELANYGLLALAIAAWLALVRKGGAGRALLAALLTGATAAVQSYYGIELYALLGLGVVALALRLAPVTEPRRGALAWTLGVMVAGALVAVLPLLPSVDYMSGMAPTAVPSSVAPSIHGTVGVGSAAGREGLPSAFLLSLLPLLALVILDRRRSSGFWLAAVALFLVLALGNVAVLWPGGGGVPMPFGWLREHVPLLWRFHYPRRFALPAALCLCVLLARVAANLGRRGGGGTGRQVWMTVGALLVVHLLGQALMARPGTSFRILPPLLPMATHPMPDVPPVLAAIGQDPGDELLLELGWETHRALTAYFQTHHQHAIPGNPVLPDEMRDSRETRSVLARHQAGLCDAAKSLPEVDWFRGHGVRYLVVYDVPGCPFDARDREPWEQREGIAPEYTGELMLLYDLRTAEAPRPEADGGDRGEARP